MKTVEFSMGRKKLHLYFNGEAMIQCEALDADRDKDAPVWIDRIMQSDSDGRETLYAVAHILAQQGEAVRRCLCLDAERTPSEDELRLLLTPMQLLGLRSSLLAAINDGYSADDKSGTGDIDVGLMELEKKTKTFARLIT